jgi:hypothetical protein
MVQETEDTSEHSSSPQAGKPFHSNVWIPEDTASHQPTPPEITGEPHGIVNIPSSAVLTGTSEYSRRKDLLKGKAWFRFALPPAGLTLRLRYFPRILVASSLQ